LQKIAYETGIGSKNSVGFGMVREINGWGYKNIDKFSFEYLKKYVNLESWVNIMIFIRAI
jgi:hypothetical protein